MNQTNSTDNSSQEYRFGIDGGSVMGQDLNKLLVNHPESTFYLRVAVNQPELGLSEGDISIVDRSLTPRLNSLVITVDQEQFRAGLYKNKQSIWGVVTYTIKKQ